MKSIIAIMLPTLLFVSSVSGQDGEPKLPPGALTEESLGQMLKTIGLKPVKTDKRYDFAFKTSVRGEEWKFSMSAVLSRNGETVWVMAWLDQIPAKAAEVPRTALLRLLAANDRMGNGKFFAYIPGNKRFVMQRVLKNQQIGPKKVTETLQDLAISVADEYPLWSVANWAPQTPGQPRIAAGANGQSGGVPAPQNQTNANRSARTQTSEANSKFGGRSVQ